MARISGVDLPREKRVEIGLTYIYGIGRTKSNEILTKAAVDPDIRCNRTQRTTQGQEKVQRRPSQIRRNN